MKNCDGRKKKFYKILSLLKNFKTLKPVLLAHSETVKFFNSLPYEKLIKAFFTNEQIGIIQSIKLTRTNWQ